MTGHFDSHAPLATHAGVLDESAERLQAAIALKFEPSELHEFEVSDRAAGAMMGQLLAFLFGVLLVLMLGVNVWMISNKSQGSDPQAPLTNPSGNETIPAAKE